MNDLRESQYPTQISGTIKNIVFINRENGYAVLRTKDGRTLCGTIPDVSADLREADFTAIGKWKRHKTYGPQFQFQELTINESDLFYFLSRIVKGVGKKLARHLLSLYEEEELVRILDSDPGILLGVKGIKEKKLKRITESWNKFRELKNLSQALAPYGASQALLTKVYWHFYEDTDITRKIRENPYILTEVKGIGFKTADSIALKMGIEPDSMYRVMSCIDFILREVTTNEGDSCIGENRFFELIQEGLSIPDTSSERAISREIYLHSIRELASKNRIVILDEEEPGLSPWLEDIPSGSQLREGENQGSKLTSAFLYRAETTILETTRRKGGIREGPIITEIEAFLSAKEKEMGIRFSSEQQEAVELINQAPLFFLLCGYAGTGKSTISRAILDLLAIRYGEESIVCCALSGIASDRIRKSSGYRAATIQSLLVQAGKTQDRLPYRVILIDEASMVNSELLYRLFIKIREDCTIILVGDPAQLPPIGAGNPFHDLLEAMLAPHVELTHIYRQRSDMVLSYFANIIREGRVPPDFQGRYEDFQFTDESIQGYYALRKTLSEKNRKALRSQNSQDILERILSLAELFKPDLEGLFQKRELTGYISYFQLITPVKNGILGADNLNNRLQALLNPYTASAQESNRQPEKIGSLDLGMVFLRLFDRVVHIANRDMDCYNPVEFKRKKSGSRAFKQRIFNGMIGMLFRFNRNDELLWVFYPADGIVVEYTFDEARDLLRLAYALTIHKTQGSEFQNVVIPISLSHFIMLNNKLLYTAITRAKKRCILVGEHYAFRSACKRKDVTLRETVLRMKTGH